MLLSCQHRYAHGNNQNCVRFSHFYHFRFLLEVHLVLFGDRDWLSLVGRWCRRYSCFFYLFRVYWNVRGRRALLILLFDHDGFYQIYLNQLHLHFHFYLRLNPRLTLLKLFSTYAQLNLSIFCEPKTSLAATFYFFYSIIFYHRYFFQLFHLIPLMPNLNFFYFYHS